MDIIALRQTISALLSDLIGSYTLPNGSQQPAVWVEGEQGVPKGWKVQGLEVSIRQYPLRRSRPLMGMVQMRKAWEVKLFQYSPGGPNLDTAIDRILRHFPDAESRGFPVSDRQYEYARILIPDVEITTQYRMDNQS